MTNIDSCVVTDEADHPDSALVMEKLENIDSETDNLDITVLLLNYTIFLPSLLPT